MSEPVHEKTNILGSDQVQHKPVCTVKEAGKKFNFGFKKKMNCTIRHGSENKGADQLRSYYCEADLSLYFRQCRFLVFPCDGSSNIVRKCGRVYFAAFN